MSITRLAGLAVGAALVFLPTSSASASVDCTIVTSKICAYIDSQTGGQCNGAADVNCDYCSQNGSSNASSNYHCDNHEPDYAWIGCTVWTGTCQIG